MKNSAWKLFAIMVVILPALIVLSYADSALGRSYSESSILGVTRADIIGWKMMYGAGRFYCPPPAPHYMFNRGAPQQFVTDPTQSQDAPKCDSMYDE